MTNLAFAQSAGCPQLYLADCGDSVRRCAFLLPRGVAPPAARLDLPATWAGQTAGCYIFLPAALKDGEQAAFAAAAWSYLEYRDRRDARFAWIENPNEAAYGLRGRFLALYQDGGEWRTDRLTRFDFGCFALLVPKGCRVMPAVDGAGFHLAQPAGGRGAIQSPSGRRHALGGELTLPLCGVEAGCLRASFALANAGIHDDLEDLDVGLRLFVRDTSFPSADGPQFLASLRYPVLSQDPADLARYGADLPLYATLDPLGPTDVLRMYFAFVGPDGQAGPAALPSCYRTNIGYTVHLTPRDRRSRLVFAARPTAMEPGVDTPYYLTPAGEFEMTVPRYAAGASQDPNDYDDNLLCGLSGVEYVKLRPDRANVLCFVPAGAAFLPGFVQGALPAVQGEGGLTATGSAGGVALAWPAASLAGLAGYHVYRSDSLDGKCSDLPSVRGMVYSAYDA
jgi:hypothetical protein